MRNYATRGIHPDRFADFPRARGLRAVASPLPATPRNPPVRAVYLAVIDDTDDGPCPCGSGRDTRRCCGAYLAGAALPTSAAALMRSRYTAFVNRDGAYLLRTWHPETRPPQLDMSGEQPQWTGLQIVACDAGGEGDDRGSVEFIADFVQEGECRQLHEVSRFVREQGVWYYLDGRFPRQRKTAPAAGRNDPCPCGSGRKYKKCCLPSLPDGRR